MNCKNCNSKKLKKVVHIGDQPLSGVFYKSIKFRAKEYSLNLYKCKKCELVQILKLAPTKKMYGATYGYQTGISNLMTSHLKNKIEVIFGAIRDYDSVNGAVKKCDAVIHLAALIGIP